MNYTVSAGQTYIFLFGINNNKIVVVVVVVVVVPTVYSEFQASSRNNFRRSPINCIYVLT